MDSTKQQQVDAADRKIESISHALSQTPDDDPNTVLLLLQLSNTHRIRFELRKEIHDIHKVIEYNSIILALIPDDSPAKQLLFYLNGDAYNQRFQQLGDLCDLEKTIECEKGALELLPNDDPKLPERLGNLAVSHKLRFERLGEPDDIEKAIDYNSRAVELTPLDHPDSSKWFERLGISYHYRFGRFGELDDLAKALKYQSCALASTADDDPKLSIRLGNLAVYHSNRFERLGNLSDLEQAINYGSRALALMPEDDPELSSCLSNLGVSHKVRFQRLGNLNDVEQAIEYESRALALTPDDRRHLINLGASHSTRFQHLGELSDLEQAINYESRALATTPDDHPDLSGFLSNLAKSHLHRFRRLDDPGDLNKAIEYNSRALALTPEDHPDFSTRLADLALPYAYQFLRLRDPSDLDKAIEYDSRALALTPNDHPDFITRLCNLAGSHGNRFRFLGDLNDLKQSMEYESSALAAIPGDHPDSSLIHFNHAMSHAQYYDISKDPSHLQKSLLSFRTSCTSFAGVPRQKFDYARQWAAQASENRALCPLEAYQATVDLLPQFIWLGSTTSQRYGDLKTIETLAVDAARTAIISSDYSLALEWLEHARCIVWNQNLMLRSPLDDLQVSYPSLATRLQTVAEQLHTAGSSSRESQAASTSMTSEQVAQAHRRLAKRYEGLLAEVRTKLGFEDFLYPMKVTGLMRAARSGPIAVIICHQDACDALIIMPNQSNVSYLPLPGFTAQEARDARSKINSSLNRQGIRERGFHKQLKPEMKDAFGNVLKTLWINVVKPILDLLGYTPLDSTKNLPHITWCPTGAASFLPLHAAGDYDQPQSRVFDYAISSYTPTLSALLSSTTSTLTCDSRMLAIGQAATPGHNPLPGTTAELKLVKSHVENGARYSELLDAQATPSTVLNALEDHDWVHLACHAHQNVSDPTKSGFFLHEGTLDLASINRRLFKKKGLAFLSACQTATGDETLPDEAVHLASGMLMAGYSSVIATMWSVGDAEAPFVADKVYGQLMIKRTLGNGEAGRALHDAVAELREKIGGKQFGRWVPFIHIGS